MTRAPEDALRTPRSLPRGRHALPKRVVLLSQRERLLEGIVEAVAKKGYAGASVADISRHAGVSRTTLYEVFEDKQDCFLAAYEDQAARLIGTIAAASAEHEHWLDQFRAGTRAYVRFLADDPEGSRVFLTEVFGAGPRALALRREIHTRHVEILELVHGRARDERPELPAPPRPVYEAAIAAINEIVVNWIGEGMGTARDEIEATILYVHLSLLGLADVAGELFPPPRKRSRVGSPPKRAD